MGFNLVAKIKDSEIRFSKSITASLSVGLALISLGGSILSPGIFELILGKWLGASDLEYSIWYGIGSVLLGITIALLGAYLIRVRKERIEHDKVIFQHFELIMDENKFLNFYNHLFIHNAIDTQDDRLLHDFSIEIGKSGNQFLTPSINLSIKNLQVSLNDLSSFLTINFFYLRDSSHQKTRYLKPDWNSDYSDSVDVQREIEYGKLSDKKDVLLKRLKDSFEEYRLKIKKELKI